MLPVYSRVGGNPGEMGRILKLATLKESGEGWKLSEEETNFNNQGNRGNMVVRRRA